MTNKRPDPASPPETPQWVKILISLFIVLVLLFVVLHLLGFGFGSHGMGNHTLLMEHALKLL